jgi:hypothetical protein
MSKNTCIVSCPIDTYSGYGARARDFVKSLIQLKDSEWDIKILSQRWGNTRFGYLEDHNEHDLKSRVIPNLDSKPDIWIQVTVPNEFQPVGKFNIGVTAGIETTMCHSSWIEGCNRMNLILTSSEHSKKVFETSAFRVENKQTGQVQKQIKLEKPVEVLFEGADLSKYKIISQKDNTLDLSYIKESFCFLFVGHWLQGDYGQDRKNVGLMIRVFLETFKNKPKGKRPALILKTQTANSSILDREAILKKIESIRKLVKGTLPNIYLIHGEMDDAEINMLYNHSKVKSMISLTRGEGFGRPLLEFSLIKKPIIASAWSGHTDFLDRELCLMVGGKLEKVHSSAVMKDMLLEESKWFTANENDAHQGLKVVHKNYKDLIVRAKKQGSQNVKNFSFDSMTKLLGKLIDTHIPELPKQIQLNIPNLKLPKLEKL